MTCALLGRTPGRCWSSTSACAASASLRPAGSDGPGCGPRGCPRPGQPGPGRPGSSAPAPRDPRGQQPLAALVQAAGRRRAGQGDEPATVGLGDAPRSAGSWPVAEPVDALGVEPVQPLPHRLWVAAQLLGDLGGALAVPAGGDHPGAPDPVAGGVPGAGQLADGVLFGGVDWWSGEQQDGHGGSLLGAHQHATVSTSTPPIPTLRNVALIDGPAAPMGIWGRAEKPESMANPQSAGPDADRSSRGS
jgi:hypothetical protein